MLQMIKQNQKWINYKIYIKRLFEKRKENINVRVSLEKLSKNCPQTVEEVSIHRENPLTARANGLCCFIVM